MHKFWMKFWRQLCTCRSKQLFKLLCIHIFIEENLEPGPDGILVSSEERIQHIQESTPVKTHIEITDDGTSLLT